MKKVVFMNVQQAYQNSFIVHTKLKKQRKWFESAKMVCLFRHYYRVEIITKFAKKFKNNVIHEKFKLKTIHISVYFSPKTNVLRCEFIDFIWLVKKKKSFSAIYKTHAVSSITINNWQIQWKKLLNLFEICKSIFSTFWKNKNIWNEYIATNS